MKPLKTLWSDLRDLMFGARPSLVAAPVPTIPDTVARTLEESRGVKPGRRKAEVHADDRKVMLVIRCKRCGRVSVGTYGVGKIEHPIRSVIRYRQKEGWRWEKGKGKTGWLCPVCAGEVAHG